MLSLGSLSIRSTARDLPWVILVTMTTVMILPEIKGEDPSGCTGTRRCGVPPHQFNCSTHRCQDGQIHPLEERTTSPAEMTTCDQCSERHCRLNLDCCGSFPYNKNRQTCCDDGMKTVLHPDKPENMFICCGLDAYPRGLDSPCVHSSNNDALKRRLAPFIGSIPCDYTYVYLLIPNGQEKPNEATRGSHVSADIHEYHVDNNGGKMATTITIPFDEYAPKRKTSRSGYLVLSRAHHTADVDFIHRRDEQIFKLQKCKILRILKKIRQWSQKCTGNSNSI